MNDMSVKGRRVDMSAQFGTSSSLRVVEPATKNDIEEMKARMAELDKRIVRAQRTADHPEFTAGFKREMNSMWNCVNLTGILAGLGLGLILCVALVWVIV